MSGHLTYIFLLYKNIFILYYSEHLTNKSICISFLGLSLACIVIVLSVSQILFTLFWWKISPKYTGQYDLDEGREMDACPDGYSTPRKGINTEPLLRKGMNGEKHGNPILGDDREPFSPNTITKYIDSDKSKESLA